MNPPLLKNRTWIGIWEPEAPRSVPPIVISVGLVAGTSPPAGVTNAASCGSRCVTNAAGLSAHEPAGKSPRMTDVTVAGVPPAARAPKGTQCVTRGYTPVIVVDDVIVPTTSVVVFVPSSYSARPPAFENRSVTCAPVVPKPEPVIVKAWFWNHAVDVTFVLVMTGAV